MIHMRKTMSLVSQYQAKTFPGMMRELVLTAREKVGPYYSYHEAAAMIREEFEEFWEIVKQKDGERNPEEALLELLDIATSCWLAAEDLDLIKADSLTDEVKGQLHTDRQTRIEKTLNKIFVNMHSSNWYNRKGVVMVPSMQQGRKNQPALLITEELFEEIRDALKDE